jgi:hypothetical protein
VASQVNLRVPEERMNMTAKEFLDLSTKLFSDMNAWISEAAKDDTLSASDLAMINASMKIVERVTLKEVEIKPEVSKLTTGPGD